MAKKKKTNRSAAPSAAEAAKAEEKRQRREARKAAEEAARARKARAARMRTLGGISLVLLLIAVGLFFAFRPGPELDGVEKLSSQGRDHLPSATSNFDYDDPAPTSGPHRPSAPACQVYSDPLPLESAVHGLEHGAVVLWYSPDAADDVRSGLIDVFSDYDSHVIVSPNPQISDPIVATAWNRRKAYETVDEDLEDFVRIYRKRGPESVDCPI